MARMCLNNRMVLRTNRMQAKGLRTNPRITEIADRPKTVPNGSRVEFIRQPHLARIATGDLYPGILP
jgi:hypothetical protein